ncbi:MAG: RNA polymerase factor sigma-54 [Neisseriaceae bacterium]|nr:RNA polymerase factor sigma-54 [Neisseriaceae bacterium]
MDTNKLTQQQALKQTLKLTPQLRQTMNLLQLSTLDLETAIEDELQKNPMLERTETPAEFDAPEPTAAISKTARRQNDSDDMDDTLANIVDEPDFYETLHAQVCELAQNERQSQLLHLLIEYLDEHGYLTDTLEYIVENSPLEWLLEEDELAEALKLLQQFDPAGVGASNLQESLILQINRLPESEITRYAIEIINKYFDLLSMANVESLLITEFRRAAKAKKPNLRISAEMRENAVSNIKAAVALIKSLNPYPDMGASDGEHNTYIRPDVRVYKKDGVWIALAEPHLRPQVAVNKHYEQNALLLERNVSSDWKKMLHDARNFVKNLEWRENTIFSVAKLIVEHQQAFFEFGDAALEPLDMQSVADKLDIHASTVSRSVNQKYLSCPHGVYELRHFFQAKVGHTDDNDEGMTNTAIKTHLAEWIAGENKAKPLSDDALREKLASVGINIARRTVAKYREAAGIPAAARRRVRR